MRIRRRIQRGGLRLGEAWTLRAGWTPLDFRGDTLTLEGQDDRDFFNLRLGTWTFGVEISL